MTNATPSNMAGQDRKQYHHEAFQLSMGGALSDRQTQVPRVMAASTLMDYALPLDPEQCNMANGRPFDDDRSANPPASDASQASFPRSLGSTSGSLQNVTMQPRQTQPFQTQTPVSMGYSQLLMGRAGSRRTVVSSSRAVTHDNVNNFEPSLPAGPPSPSMLNMQQLSLVDTPGRPLPATPKSPMAPTPHTSVFLQPTVLWAT
jgi:hypothetical protein